MTPGGKRYVYVSSTAAQVRIWDIADIHLFNAACALSHVKATIKRIKDDPFALWVGGGDYAEYISPTDKRWDPSSVSAYLLAKDLGTLGKTQTGAVLDLFKPIKHKCLGLCYGNHESKYMTAMEQQDLHGWLCTELGVMNLQYSAFFDVVFRFRKGMEGAVIGTGPDKANSTGLHSYRIFIHHGAGGAQTEGGKINRLMGFMTGFEADIYFMGHVHDKMPKPIDVVGANADCSKLVAKRRVGIITGSFLKTYSENTTSYGEMKGYKPVPLGSGRAEIDLKTGLVEGVA